MGMDFFNFFFQKIDKIGKLKINSMCHQDIPS
jgi:hypothetical protein